MEIGIENITDLPAASVAFIEAIGEKKIIAINAEMGTGKTTFILTLLSAMGVEDASGSPTYSLVNKYESPMFGTIYHFDLYRLKDLNEAFDIGMEEMLYEDAYCFIEWPDIAKEILPDETIWVEMRTNQDQSRTLTLEV
jgi:tRNA threonylcarbamoyladenosine biosynthesis protein TsaE